MSELQAVPTFLLGSGVSCAAGLPNLQTLSCAVASSISGPEANLLEVIKLLSAATHGDGRHSYEDWFFVADQIYQHEAGDFENPVVLPLMERLRCSLGMSNDAIRAAAERLCLGIAATAHCELSPRESRSDRAFEGLADVIQKRPNPFRFFSLNHDTLLESWLKKHGINPYMCLEQHPDSPAYERVRFSPQDFDAARVSVIKLHGSLDWRRFRPKSARKAADPFRGEFLGVCDEEDPRFEEMDDGPRTLTGTWNKIVQYSSPVFLPMFSQFHRCLRDSSRLVVCGYGFGDKGINSLLIDWISSNEERRLIVIDPDPFHPSRCRQAVFDKFEVWKSDGRLEVIRRRVSKDDMTWTEILEMTDGR
jgi:hypothetical protein